MKVSELLNEAQEQTTVDLENFDKKSIPHTAWPDGVTYKGLNVFKEIYDGGEAEKQINKAMSYMKEHFDGKLDMQESYLGFSPSRDLFIQGYDGWATITDTNNWDHDSSEDEGGDEENEDEEQDYNCSPYILFKLKEDGSIKVVEAHDDYGNEQTWYSSKHGGGGLKTAHRNFSDLIDIRLD